MNYSIVDFVGVIGGTAACAALLLLPGLAIGHITNVFGFRQIKTARIYPLALVLGYAVLPVLDSLLSRFLGLGAALAFNLLLAGYGLRVAWLAGMPRPDRLALTACGIWMALLVYAWIDLDTGARLYPSLLMLDVVKHAATVRALVETGFAPPIDPFFMREAPAGYYYFYYVLSALAERLCAGWIELARRHGRPGVLDRHRNRRPRLSGARESRVGRPDAPASRPRPDVRGRPADHSRGDGRSRRSPVARPDRLVERPGRQLAGLAVMGPPSRGVPDCLLGRVSSARRDGRPQRRPSIAAKHRNR